MYLLFLCNYFNTHGYECSTTKASGDQGIDLVGITSSKIYATCDGKVHKIGYDKSYGNYVVVKENKAERYPWYRRIYKRNK
mgnify:CR=1 FL=1